MWVGVGDRYLYVFVCIVHMACIVCIDSYRSVLEGLCVYQQVL